MIINDIFFVFFSCFDIFFRFAVTEFFAVNIRSFDIEEICIFRNGKVSGDGIRKPKKIVGGTRSAALDFTVFAVMPPMKNISLFKLPRSG